VKVQSTLALKRSTRTNSEVAKLLQGFDFKSFFTKRNGFIIFILFILQFYLSDGSLLGFIKQLLGWLIVPFLSGMVKQK